MTFSLSNISPKRFPALTGLLAALLQSWPEHEKFLIRSFRDRDEAMLETTDRVARMTLDLAGEDIQGLCEDYRWTCDRLLEEEFEFRRTGHYRNTSFDAAFREVYSRPEFMSRYINGLLLSQTAWSNHAAVMDVYLRKFLPRLPEGSRLVEVGPGHGLIICLAAASGRIGSLAGWDVSKTSVESTRAALARMKVAQQVTLRVRDILQPSSEQETFDVVVMCEVLEHLEAPDEALRQARQVMAPDGWLFVSVPVNSPAPDHIYLLRSPAEAADLVRRNGFEIDDAHYFPMGGWTLERAERSGITISCAIVGRPR
jgi:2-polyprenyl-3-methyl-5-hydroxy-6-metoxy-1,4-benzoquinol methylase